MNAAARPDFPHALDSTMLSSFRSCPQKFFRTYVEHWKPKSESVHLIAGAAFASGLEAARRAFYEDGKPVEDSLALGLEALIHRYGSFECPPDSPKSLERMAGALEYYFSQYPLGSSVAGTPLLLPSGKRAIEFSFAEPLPILHPQTGDPLIYCGRSDMVMEFAGGEYVEDDKTASQLGASWSKQWTLRSQFCGYTWARRKAGGSPQGVIVRGVSILKTKYDTAQAIVSFPRWETDRWYEQTMVDIQRMLVAWEKQRWDYNLDHACAEYGGCSLVQICKSPNPEDWLPMYFQPKVWDPLLREELTPEQYAAQWRKPEQPAT